MPMLIGKELMSAASWKVGEVPSLKDKNLFFPNFSTCFKDAWSTNSVSEPKHARINMQKQFSPIDSNHNRFLEALVHSRPTSPPINLYFETKMA